MGALIKERDELWTAVNDFSPFLCEVLLASLAP